MGLTLDDFDTLAPVDDVDPTPRSLPTPALGDQDDRQLIAVEATPGSPAAMMADFELIVARRDAAFARLLDQQRADFAALVERHSSDITLRVDDLKATVNSNHGHITKRLFPDVDNRLTSLEQLLAATTSGLEAKGESLLARITSFEATAPAHAGSAGLPRAPRQREPPDDDDPIPATSRRSTVTVVVDDVAHDALGMDHPADAGPADDTGMDVTARSRLAYKRARALNPPLGTSAGRPPDTPHRVPATVPRRLPFGTPTTLPPRPGPLSVRLPYWRLWAPAGSRDTPPISIRG